MSAGGRPRPRSDWYVIPDSVRISGVDKRNGTESQNVRSGRTYTGKVASTSEKTPRQCQSINKLFCVRTRLMADT